MLRERYAAENIFERIAVVDIAMEPVLSELDRLLDDDELVKRVKADLARRYPKTLLTGR